MGVKNVWPSHHQFFHHFSQCSETALSPYISLHIPPHIYASIYNQVYHSNLDTIIHIQINTSICEKATNVYALRWEQRCWYLGYVTLSWSRRSDTTTQKCIMWPWLGGVNNFVTSCDKGGLKNPFFCMTFFMEAPLGKKMYFKTYMNTCFKLKLIITTCCAE